MHASTKDIWLKYFWPIYSEKYNLLENNFLFAPYVCKNVFLSFAASVHLEEAFILNVMTGAGNLFMPLKWRSGTRGRCRILMMEAGWQAEGRCWRMQVSPGCPVREDAAASGRGRQGNRRLVRPRNRCLYLTPVSKFLLSPVSGCVNKRKRFRFLDDFEDSFSSTKKKMPWHTTNQKYYKITF